MKKSNGPGCRLPNQGRLHQCEPPSARYERAAPQENAHNDGQTDHDVTRGGDSCNRVSWPCMAAAIGENGMMVVDVEIRLCQKQEVGQGPCITRV